MNSEISIGDVDAGDGAVKAPPNDERFDRHVKPCRNALVDDVLVKLGVPVLGDIAPPATIGALAIGHAQTGLATAVAALACSDQVGRVHLTSARRLLAVAVRSLDAAVAAASLDVAASAANHSCLSSASTANASRTVTAACGARV